MKYSVFTVGLPTLTPEQAVKELARCGYDGVEWRVIKVNHEFDGEEPSYWKNNLCTVDEERIEELAESTKALGEAHGLEISAVCSYLRSSDDLGRIEKVMQATKTMGATKLRISPDGYDGSKDYRELFAKAVEDYGNIEKLAKKHGVQVLLEMHMNTITASASAAYRLASHFDPKYISVIYDTGNVVYEGYEDYKAALEILGEYLGHVHLKNAAWQVDKEEDGVKLHKCGWAPLKEGQADLARFLKALKGVGYDGWITFEDFSDTPLEEKLSGNLEYIKAIVDAL